MIKLLLLCPLVFANTSPWVDILARVQKVGTFTRANPSIGLDANYSIHLSLNTKGYSTQDNIFVWGTVKDSVFTPESFTVNYSSVLEGATHNTYTDKWTFIGDAQGILLQVGRHTTIVGPSGRVISDINSIELPLNLVVQETWQEQLERWYIYLSRL